jgi:cyclopropane fatty-acyl-phospholipid synthase-like methyltransferase
VLKNLMGPNVLWLTEALSQRLVFEPGTRVLDLGCGKAVSSIFLAKEFGVRVWAADLWIAPDENWERIQESHVSELVVPVRAEAHDLPFARGFFDVLVSMDAYHYFGTDDLYLGYCLNFLKPGGRVGIIVPGLVREFESEVPRHLVPYWQWEFCSFHSPEWWRRHWAQTGLVDVESADLVGDGWKLWLHWLQIAKEHGYRSSDSEIEMLRVDEGRNLGFARIVARTSTSGAN